MTDPSPQPPESGHTPGGEKPPLRNRLLEAGVTVAVLILVFGFVLPKLADYRTILDIVGGISAGHWALLAIFAGWFLVAYVAVFMATLPGLRFREGFVVQTTATAINNSLPAGGAIALPITYSQFLSWGFTPEAVTAALLTAGVWDQLARMALPVLAVGLVALSDDAIWWMWLVSAGGIAVVAGTLALLSAVLRSETAARTLGAWIDGVVNRILATFRREPVDVVSATIQFRDNVRNVAANRWPWITAATVANHASMAALFLVSLRAVGVTADDVSMPWVLLAFALGRLLVMIPVSPGGLGLVDLGFIGLLTLGWGTGADANLIAAGVLLYRGLSYFPPILAGVGSWLFWRVDKRWRRDRQVARRGEPAAP